MEAKMANSDLETEVHWLAAPVGDLIRAVSRLRDDVKTEFEEVKRRLLGLEEGQKGLEEGQKGLEEGQKQISGKLDKILKHLNIE